MATPARDPSPTHLSSRDSFVSENDGDFDIDTNVQMSGMLWKKPFGGKKKQKWQRRFLNIFRFLHLQCLVVRCS